MKILVVDHPYHKFTKSFDFVTEPLSRRHAVEHLFHNTYETPLPPAALEGCDALLFLQVPPKQPHLNCTWVPMYDSLALSRKGAFQPLGLSGLKHLCFCRRLYEEASRHGVDARYYQYWPSPGSAVRYGEPAVFFWYRTSAVTWEDAKRIIGDFKVARVFVKNNPDPGFDRILIPASDRKRYRIEECDSFLSREEYEKVLASHNINIASRPFEGIGRTTLELMSRGYCVVALDRPAANEYLVHGKTGILLPEIGSADLRNFAAIGQAARKTVARESAEWARRLDEMLDYVAAPAGGGQAGGTVSEKPFFSVVTCCYNQGRYLRDNIESVLAQRWPGFEHIVVDDGSTDETAAVCARYPHVRYLRQENAGQSAALNRGFREARGEIIAWLNSDDYYEPGAFERVAREIGRLRRGEIVTGDARLVDAAGAEIRVLGKGAVSFHRLLYHHLLHALGGRTSMPCQPSTFFHRKLFEKLGPLDTTLVYAMDYDYWLRAFEAGYRFLYVPRIFSNYRFHATSHSNQGWETFMGEWTAVSERHYRARTPLRRRLADCRACALRLETAVLRRVRAARNA